ncbi:hypothetical protein FHG87_000875 [Trinorchestia longiramus]|nr:hypothetical protein FHG87_000875 [Trinorchestia longiramus]
MRKFAVEFSCNIPVVQVKCARPLSRCCYLSHASLGDLILSAAPLDAAGSRPVFLKVVRTTPLGALRKCKEAVGGYALNEGVCYCIIYSKIMIRERWKIKVF